MGLATTPCDPPALWRPPLWVGLVWGFAEATLFFIIPDVVITWAALGSVRHGVKMLAAASIGALVGGLLMYGLATWQPESARAAVDAVPFVRHAMFDTVASAYGEWGPAALLHAPGNGIPFKVYAVLAPPVVRPGTFAVLTVPARLERFAIGWLLSTAIGWALRRWIRAHPLAITVMFWSCWIAGYALYWSLI